MTRSLAFVQRSVTLAAALLVVCIPGLANQSLSLTPGAVLNFNVSAISPFTTLQSTRLEMRVHDFSPPPTGVTTIYQNAGFRVYLRSTSEICASDIMDVLASFGGDECSNVTGLNDVTLRIQRDTSKKITTYEVWDTQSGVATVTYCGYQDNGTAGNTFSCPIDTVFSNSWAGAGAVGDVNTQVHIAWIKWYSTTVPAGAVTTEFAPADLTDWRFEGNNNDQAQYGINLGGGSAYSATPTYAPVCSAGVQQVFRAGVPTTLDGTASYPLDGTNALQYKWQELGGPNPVLWANQNVAHSTFSGMLFGSYLFQLTVTDSSGQSAACMVKKGAVATDGNDVVVLPDPRLDTLIGPLILYGSNPWPWYDDRQVALANAQIADLAVGQPYGPWWRTFNTGPTDTGTITVTGGSATVTGIGTQFTAALDNGTTPKGGAILLLQYTGTDGRTHYTIRPIASIASDTSLTIGAVYPTSTTLWGALPNCDSGCTGLSYSLHWDGNDGSTYGAWSFNTAPANYYDNVVALYTLYYRTGIDTYLTWARTLADEFWESPQIDQGTSCDAFLSVPSNYTACFPGRSMSLLGLMVRMVEGNLQSTMLPGLRIIWTREKFLLGSYYNARGRIDDLREQVYDTAALAYCGLLETNTTYGFSFPNTGNDATQQQDCQNALVNTISGIWEPYKSGDGGWDSFFAFGNNTSVVSYDYAGTGSVSLTNGSTAVTGTSTGWNCSALNSPIDGFLWFFPAPANTIPVYGTGDTTYYKAHCNSATSFTLAAPYAGPTQSGAGWAWAPDPASGMSNTFLGWGQQPYAQGLAGIVFELAGRSLDGYNNSARDTFYGYNDRSVQWLMNRGMDRNNSGMYLGSFFVCGYPILPTDLMCGNPTATPDQRRQLSAEVVRAMGLNYLRTRNATVLAQADILMSQMFSKPGTGGPNPDGFYLNQLDPGGIAISGAPPLGTAAKWTGQDFGFPESGSTWPAQRLGGRIPIFPRWVPINFALNQVPGAAQVRFTLTSPDGTISQTSCSSSPCQLQADGREGDHVAKIQYLSSGGAILATGQPFVLSLH